MRRRIVLIAATVIVVIVVLVASWSVWTAGEAGLLPWQEEPTRIAITPFADLPSDAASGTPDANGTP